MLIFCSPLTFRVCALTAVELIWMDNVYCSGEEQALADCQFDGWKLHDCTTNEAAGVLCKTRHNQTIPVLTSSNSSGPDLKYNRIDGNTSGSNQTRISQSLTISNDAPLLTNPIITSNTKIRVFPINY